MKQCYNGFCDDTQGSHLFLLQIVLKQLQQYKNIIKLFRFENKRDKT